MANPIKIDTGMRVGQISAEADDEFLFDCFFDHPALTEIKDINSSKMFLLGSTGIGKTALLRMIEKQEEHCQCVELDEMSMSYISNSDVISFLNGLDVPLDHFLQALWKHVICIEYIRLKFNVDSARKSVSVWRKISSYFESDDTKKKALKYLAKYDKSFWISMDESIREVTTKLETDIRANFGTELEKFNTDAGFVRKLGAEKKAQLRQRLRKFVDADLLSDLAQVIRALSDYKNGKEQATYILIDKLDENWVSPDIKYKLVRALIESLKGLRKINSLKVIVAMRSDLMEKVVDETKELGFQSEKYEDYMLRVKWNGDQLKKLINNRINFLYRRKYSSENIFFEDIFPDKINNEKTISYLLERTLLRPRDIINFVNFCFEKAEGQSALSQSIITSAEKDYSEDRRRALIDEWRAVYPGIEPTLRVLEGRRAHFQLSELHSSDLANDLVTYFYEKDVYQYDSICKLLEHATDASGDFKTFEILVQLMQRLYLVGAIGVNTKPEMPVQWFYKSQKQISPSAFSLESKVRIHKMLHSSLNIRR